MVMRTVGDQKNAWQASQGNPFPDGKGYAEILIKESIAKKDYKKFELPELGTDNYDPRFRPHTIQEAIERYQAEGESCVDSVFRECFERDRQNNPSFHRVIRPITDLTTALYLTEKAINSYLTFSAPGSAGVFLVTDKDIDLPEIFSDLLIKCYQDNPEKLGIFYTNSSISPSSKLSAHIPNLRRREVTYTGPNMNGAYRVFSPSMRLEFVITGQEKVYGRENLISGGCSFSRNLLTDSPSYEQDRYEIYQKNLERLILGQVIPSKDPIKEMKKGPYLDPVTHKIR